MGVSSGCNFHIHVAIESKKPKEPKNFSRESNLSRGGLYSILNGCEVKRKTIKVFENENDSWNLILYTFFVERTGVAKLGVFDPK